MSLPIQVSYPQTTFDFVDGLVHTTILAASITTPACIAAAIVDGAANPGAADQILTAGAGGALLWVDPTVPGTPGLAAVLGESGDAAQLGMSNVLSVGLSADGINSAVVAGVAGQVYLDISTPVDESGAQKQFTGKYAKMSFDGALYYMPLFIPV